MDPNYQSNKYIAINLREYQKHYNCLTAISSFRLFCKINALMIGINSWLRIMYMSIYATFCEITIYYYIKRAMFGLALARICCTCSIFYVIRMNWIFKSGYYRFHFLSRTWPIHMYLCIYLCTIHFEKEYQYETRLL